MFVKIRDIKPFFRAFNHAEFLKSFERKPDCCQRLSENYRKHFIRVWKFIFDQNQPAGVAFAGQRNDPDPDNKDCIPIRHGLNDLDFFVVEHINPQFDPAYFSHWKHPLNYKYLLIISRLDCGFLASCFFAVGSISFRKLTSFFMPDSLAAARFFLITSLFSATFA